jgi:hypothetical protein
MGNRFDAKDALAFAVDLERQLATAQLEDRQTQVSRPRLAIRPTALVVGDISDDACIRGSF